MSMMTPMRTDLTRRGLLAAAAAAALVLPGRAAQALTTDEARNLIARLVADINRIINSGKPEAAMYGDFRRVLQKYGDTQVIAQKVLGVDWRRATANQRRAFTDAFEGYLSRKYGARFREFIGGEIEVISSRQVRSVFEVITTAKLRGQAPFEVRWLVADKNGDPRMFNMLIEGINVTSTEATEIGAMLDKRRGDIDQLIADLRTAG